MSEKKLFLLDAYALIYRAHFAFVKTPRINSKGINTSVPFGFTNTLLEVLFKQKPTHIGIAFDTSAPTFRDEIFTEYKANRQETPEDIRAGVPTVKEIIRGFNIPILELDGYEADDVIGTISKKAAAQGFEVYMMTPDKDYGQLVDKNVFLYKPAFLGNAVDIMGEKEICERWDINNVSQVIEILGLQGDSVDNIPGIPGFGPKTAAELIKKYGTIENIIANAHELKGKKKELVEQYGEQALLSKKLATIFTEVPLEFKEEDLVYTGPDKEKLKPIFDHLEFKTLAARVFSDGNAPATIKAPETSQLSMFGGGETNAGEQQTDTSSQSFDASKVSYKALVREDECKNLADKLNKQKEFSLELSKDTDEKFMLAFAMQAAEVNYIQFTKTETTLLKIFEEVLTNKAVGKIGYNIKSTLLALKEFGLMVMEFEGVKVDTVVLTKMSEELRTASEAVQAEIFKEAGTEFNIGSPKQLGEILFDKMKLVDKAKKTKTGQYATGEEVLATLADEHPIAKKILDYREYEKLRSTYVDALPKLISARDGRIHTDYRQAVAATGRLSSNNPNLQNIPIRTEKGRAIRKAFVARDENFLFMSADYSQIELRIAASFAKDETMIEAFKNKRDIHATTAAKVFGVPLEQVTPDMRRKAKEVNFGILYGSTAFGLSQNLGISRTEAAEIIESYFKEFPGIKRYMDESINQAREKEYVETILGRRRYLRDINSRNVTTRGFAERNAINAPIQGSAADIIKIAMVNIQQWMKKEQVRSRMIMQVHDELVFDLHKEEKDHVKENVVRLMKHAIQLEVPMEVEAGVGLNWLEAH
ncbi:MAG: DNA polymerase I [Cytophagia bacterium]|nr:DNA polymerase I [Cytophagia bacterium]